MTCRYCGAATSGLICFAAAGRLAQTPEGACPADRTPFR
jgi:hypothetical protein